MNSDEVINIQDIIVLINFVLIFSPFIIVYRLLNNKEDYSRVKEKLGYKIFYKIKQ